MIRLQSNIIRNDFKGLGYYKAKRGNRLHNGVDLLCLPNLPIYADCDLEFIRIAKPYAGYNGGLWRSEDGREIKIFYCDPVNKKYFEKDEIIAFCQDVSEHEMMMPHVHCEIFIDGQRVNPEHEIEIIRKST